MPTTKRVVPHHLSKQELDFAFLKLKVRPSDIATPPIGIVIGEQPSEAGQGRGFGPGVALFPWPSQCSSARLAKMAGLSPAEWLGLFWRRNLFDEYADRRHTKELPGRVAELRRWIWERAKTIDCGLPIPGGHVRVLLLGDRVADAFGIEVFGKVFVEMSDDGCSAAYRAIPHPSGRNRLYNDATNIDRARYAVLWAARKTDEE